MDQNPEGQDQNPITGNNQSQPSSPTPSGAIFSGSPATSTNASTSSQTTPQNNRKFFAHHPSHTFSSEMGDIVVGGAPQKKGKKPLIIISVIIAALLIISSVLIIVIMQVSASDARRNAFLAYANYIISGENISNQLPAFNANTAEYRIYTITYTDDNTQSTYFDRLDDLSYSLTDLDVVAHLNSEDQAALTTLMESIRAWQEAFMFYNTQEEIINAYIEHGSDGVQQLAQEMYSNLISSGNSNISNIGEMLIDAQRYRSLFFEQLNEQGCLPNDTSETCMAAAADLEASSGLGVQLEELVERTRLQAANQLDTALPAIWTIANDLGIGSQE